MLPGGEARITSGAYVTAPRSVASVDARSAWWAGLGREEVEREALGRGGASRGSPTSSPPLERWAPARVIGRVRAPLPSQLVRKYGEHLGPRVRRSCADSAAGVLQGSLNVGRRVLLPAASLAQAGPSSRLKRTRKG